MEKTHKVVMLPTDKSDNALIMIDGHLSYSGTYLTQDYIRRIRGGSYYIYIISEEEVKKGDYFIPLVTPHLAECTDDTLKIGILSDTTQMAYDRDFIQKVIATNDPVLHGQVDKVLTNVPKIPEAFVKAYAKANGIDEVQLEYDYEVPEGGHLILDAEYPLKLREDNTVIIHQAKTYSRQEVIGVLESLKFNDEGHMSSIMEYTHNARFDEHIDNFIKNF